MILPRHMHGGWQSTSGALNPKRLRKVSSTLRQSLPRTTRLYVCHDSQDILSSPRQSLLRTDQVCAFFIQ